MADEKKDWTPEEVAAARGDLGVEKCPWATPRLLRRIEAEAMRLVSAHEGRMDGLVLSVAAPEVVERWLAGSLMWYTENVVGLMREYGSGPEGAVWPGCLETYKILFAMQGQPALSAALRPTVPLGHIFIVAHWEDRDGEHCAVVPYRILPGEKAQA